MLEIVDYAISGAKLEGCCTLCEWSYFAREEQELRRAYQYHYNEIHDEEYIEARRASAKGAMMTSRSPADA